MGGRDGRVGKGCGVGRGEWGRGTEQDREGDSEVGWVEIVKGVAGWGGSGNGKGSMNSREVGGEIT